MVGAQPARERQRHLTMSLLTATSVVCLFSCLTGRRLKALRRFFCCIRGQRDSHAIRSIKNHDASFCAGQTGGRAEPFMSFSEGVICFPRKVPALSDLRRIGPVTGANGEHICSKRH